MNDAYVPPGQLIDPETGLPLLHEGEFWKVCKGMRGDYIELRRYRTYFGSKLLGWNPIYGTLDKDVIVVAAREALKDIEDKQGAARLYGKYPPKRL